MTTEQHIAATPLVKTIQELKQQLSAWERCTKWSDNSVLIKGPRGGEYVQLEHVDFNVVRAVTMANLAERILASTMELEKI